MSEHLIISITFFEPRLGYGQRNRNSIPGRGRIFLLSTALLSSLGFTTLLTNGYGGNFPQHYAAKTVFRKSWYKKSHEGLGTREWIIQ